MDTSDAAPDSRASTATAVGTFGLALLLVSLSVLFAASMVGYLIVRVRSDQWPPTGAPNLPIGLWVSTVVLLISSGTMHQALRSARAGRQRALAAAMLVTTLLGLVSMISQAWCWSHLIGRNLGAGSNLYGFTFYLLTGLHAAHVIGGLIVLVLVTVRAYRGDYGIENHRPVMHCAMYWHFLDVVWVIIFLVLQIAS